MKKAVFLLCGLCITVWAIAQSYTIDSMKRILRSTSLIDSNKVKTCMRLSNEWLKIDIDSALVYADKSYEMAASANYQPGLADAKLLQANIYSLRETYDKAYEFYLEALHKYTVLNDFYGMGKVYIELGKTFNKQDNYSKGLTYFKQALTAFEKAGSASGTARTYIEMGLAHSSVNETDLAITQFLKAADKAQLSLDRLTAIECYNYLCKEYGQIGNFEKAVQSAIRAKNLALIAGSLPALAEANYNLGNACRDVNNYASAQSAYQAALAGFLQMRNKERIAKTYDGIGELYFMQNNYALATQNIKLSNQYALDLKDKKLLQVNYIALLSIAKAQGDYKMASSYFDEILALKDTIYSTDKNVSISKVKSSYELEKKEAMIAELQQDNIDKTHQRNLFIIGFSIVGVCLIALGYSIYNTSKKTQILEKQKKELEDLNFMKDKFFSMISHDLRAPMANIIGLLQVLGEENLISEAERRQLFNVLTESTTSALETMDNMLAWGMSQIKQNETEKSIIDVQEISERVCRLLQRTAENKSIQLINHVNEPIKILADKNQVEFVLRNLVSNALKFSHKNGVVELWASNANGAKNIHIRDTGTGMSAEVKHKLFEEKKNTTTKGTNGETGSGLGLMLSKQFITKNNGSLSVKSEQGKGSEFTISLPHLV